MTTSEIDFDSFSSKLADPTPSVQALWNHPRFSQVISRINGTHPNLRIGQVWEERNSWDGPDTPPRQVVVTRLSNDGTVFVKNIYVRDADSNDLGMMREIPVADFTALGNGMTSYRLAYLIIPLQQSGAPKNGYEVPQNVSLAEISRGIKRSNKNTAARRHPRKIEKANTSTTKMPTPTNSSRTLSEIAAGIKFSETSKESESTEENRISGSAVVVRQEELPARTDIPRPRPSKEAVLFRAPQSREAVDSQTAQKRFETMCGILAKLDQDNSDGTVQLIHKKMSARLLAQMTFDDAKEFIESDYAHDHIIDSKAFMTSFTSIVNAYCSSRKKNS